MKYISNLIFILTFFTSSIYAIAQNKSLTAKDIINTLEYNSIDIELPGEREQLYKVQIILNSSLEQETLNFGIAEGGTILSLFTKKNDAVVENYILFRRWHNETRISRSSKRSFKASFKHDENLSFIKQDVKGTDEIIIFTSSKYKAKLILNKQ